ncbi:tetratricopeptide repeat (TPR)-like superfamily protein [Artemisia annua]|uniref:Tetratricopeptide repeat (TPR)-like superfamily protein n=1 Tax=Artemisia annua TaxID=35608 RepID=A0A2U1MT30_ARTAN|nr:tetratricopeptide repeat (TPR)-like superfamily protein [Artemisia annua]
MSSTTTTTLVILSSSISNPPPLPKHPPSTNPKPSPKHPKSHSHRPLLTTVQFPKHPHKQTQNTSYYAQLASKLAEEAKFDDFFMIVETVGSVDGGLISECVCKGLLSLVESGELRKVVRVLGGFVKLGIKGLVCDGAVFDAVKRECRKGLKCGQLEVVVDLLEVLSGFPLSIEDVLEPVEVIRTCVYKRNPRAAIRYAGLCTRSDEIFCKAILEFGKRGDMASALTVFEASKDNLGCVNMYAYRTIIDVCGLCRDHLQSRSIYEGLSAQNINPNLYVFNSLMNVNACDLGYTMNIYKHMQNLGVVPDIASYNILLKSCCLAARLDTAQEIYREVEDLESKGSLKLDVFTYSTMIKVYADAKMWQIALGMKDKMVEAGVTPNAVTWSSLISACAKAGLVDQAFVLFEEMLLAGCMPNSQCCNVLLYACVQAFQYDRAFRLFHSWKSNSFQITNRNLTQESSQVVPMKVPFKPTTATYNVLMKACGTDHFLAKALMEEMETVGLSPNHISWSTLIGVYGGSGDVKNAVQVLKTMRESDVPPDVIAYTAAIKVCVKHRQLNLAFSLFAEMKKYRIQPNMVTYNTLLRARTKYGSLIEVQQCLSIYRDMRKAGFKPNDYYLKELIEEWCEGIIQDNNRSQGQLKSSNKRDLGGPQSLLLEKVASHLEMGNAEAQSIAVDVQGLTKVEARIVVLAVLRMIKENYNPGDYVRDDMFIILGVQELGTAAEKHQIDVRDTIIKLLRDNLGLEVLTLGPKIPTDIRINVENPFNPHPDLDKTLERSRLPTSPTRRPAVLQRLKVTRRSLYQWLQRKSNA